jgi:Flp pilus assembly protein CpaB
MRLFIIFIALVVAVAAGVGFWLVNQEPDEIVQSPEATEIVVAETTILTARQDIPVGKKIDENDIDRQVWPAHLVHPDFITEGNESQLIDKVARTNFKQGQPLVGSFLANPNDPGFLAAQLPEGMRAVTIRVDAVTGINGFVFPGDRVDVIVKHQVGLEQDYKSQTDISSTAGNGEGAATGAPAETPTTVQYLSRESSYSVPLLMTTEKRSGRPNMNITEVLIPNARVMAVGMVPAQYEGAQSEPTSVTLEVSDVQAQMLRHAEEGTLSLALRSIEDAESTRPIRPVADADMTKITPPAYFPYLYSIGEYGSEEVSLEEVDYENTAQQEDTQDKKQIAIIRGVKKEIVGVERP